MVRLRATTQDVHNDLHESRALRHLLSPTLSAAAYRRILEGFDGFLEAAETQVLIPAQAWFAEHGFPWTSRRSDLARDLADLTEAGTGPGPDAQRRSPSPPALGPALGPGVGLAPGHGTALGVLYVVEGSRLGGRGIARHLQKALPRPIQGATRFLGSPGADISAHWKAVGTLIDGQGHAPAVADEAVEAARHAFAALTIWFDEAP